MCLASDSTNESDGRKYILLNINIHKETMCELYSQLMYQTLDVYNKQHRCSQNDVEDMWIGQWNNDIIKSNFIKAEQHIWSINHKWIIHFIALYPIVFFVHFSISTIYLYCLLVFYFHTLFHIMHIASVFLNVLILMIMVRKVFLSADLSVYTSFM